MGVLGTSHDAVTVFGNCFGPLLTPVLLPIVPLRNPGCAQNTVANCSDP